MSDLVERISVAHKGVVVGLIAGLKGTLHIGGEKDAGVYVHSHKELMLWSETGETTLNSGVAIGYEGPTITSGPAPTAGSVSDRRPGSLHISTGGSLWITSANKQWTRIQ